MELTELMLRVLFLFLPGIVSYLIIESLTEKKHDTPFMFIIKSFVLGCISYLILSFLYWLINSIRIWQNYNSELSVGLFEVINNEVFIVNVKEIFWASLISVGLAFLVSLAVKQTWLHRFARFIGVSSSTGYNDVWHDLISKNYIEWVAIRDIKRDMVFEGWIQKYSFSHQDSEILLRDVKVYDSKTGEFKYELEGQYIIFDKDNMIMEFTKFGG